MKKLLLLLICCLSACCFPVAAQESRLLNPATDNTVAAQLSKSVKQHQLLRLNTLQTEKLLQSRPAELIVEIPYGDQTYRLTLKKNNILSTGFKVTNNNPKQPTASYTPGLYYRGVVEGSKGSFAAISIFKNEVMGVFSGQGGNMVIGRLQPAG